MFYIGDGNGEFGVLTIPFEDFISEIKKQSDCSKISLSIFRATAESVKIAEDLYALQSKGILERVDDNGIPIQPEDINKDFYKSLEELRKFAIECVGERLIEAEEKEIENMFGAK